MNTSRSRSEKPSERKRPFDFEFDEARARLTAAPQTFKSWVEWMVQYLFWSSLPLGLYAQSTVSVNPPGISERATGDLFPCPPPFPWKTVTKHGQSRSRRKAQRYSKRRSVELMVNLMIVALNHQALGVSKCPSGGYCGDSLTPDQQEMCQHLIKLSKSVCCLGDSTAGCGTRMPATASRLERLRKEFEDVSHLSYAETVSCMRSETISSTVALPVIADRLSLPPEIRDFDPIPYLQPVFQALYLDPDQFLLEESDMPPALKVRGTATKSELLKVFARWDKLGRLYIAGEKQINKADICALFSVTKDAEHDRQIIHRRPRNIREKHIVGASRDLPHGVMMTLLPLEKDHNAYGSVDGIKNFYHAFAASEKRALSTPIRHSFKGSELGHLKAYRDAVLHGRIKAGDRAVACFRGLAMGDHAAVDIAQECHSQLLKCYGAMRDDEVLNYKKPMPCPKTNFYKPFMVDDHLGVQLLPKTRRLLQGAEISARDTEVFQAAGNAYRAVNLEAHEGKKVRRSPTFKAWGTEVEGIVGLAGPVRSRLFALMRLSAEASRPGAIEEKICQGITGLWAFCAQFRRPMFSFLHALYSQHAPQGEKVFRLDRAARNELLVLACLGPCCISDLRAVPDGNLYCVDASPSGAGVCKTWVGPHVAREVWRRGDKQGYRAPALSKLGSYLKGKGWDEEQVEEFLADDELSEDNEAQVPGLCSQSCLPEAVQAAQLSGLVPKSLSEVPYDFVEVYAGCAQMSTAWAKQGFRVLNPIERLRGCDMISCDLFHVLLHLCEAKMVRFVWWAPPRTTFSLAQFPKLRSQDQPWGFKIFDLKTLEENFHALQCFLLAWMQWKVGWWFCGEQPAFGFMHFLPVWKWFVVHGCFETLFDWCRFKQPFRKRTRLLHNFEPLKTLGRSCNHSQKHLKLEGSLTTKAGAYSAAFCEAVAGIVHSHESDFLKGFSGEVGGFGETFLGNTPVVETPCSNEGPTRRVPKPRRVDQKVRSHLWAVQMSESLRWKTMIQYRFRKVQHINLQEGKARRTLFKRLGHSKRVCVFQDSKVSIGALGRGRSPSVALNGILKSEAPYILGKNLYPSSIHLPTWTIRADDPSRFVGVREPRGIIPPWIFLLRKGIHASEVQDEMQEQLPRAFNRWFVFCSFLLQRASSFGSPGFSQRTSECESVTFGVCDSEHPPFTSQTAVRFDRMVESRNSTMGFGNAGSQFSESFERMVSRIHQLAILARTESSRRCRNLEQSGSTVWVAPSSAQPSMELNQDLGKSRTSYTPSSHTPQGSPGYVGSLHRLGLAEDGNHFGLRLLCAVEAHRSLILETRRCGHAFREPRRFNHLCEDSFPQNTFSRSLPTTCTSRPPRCRWFCEFIPTWDSQVATYLGGLLSSFSEPI